MEQVLLLLLLAAVVIIVLVGRALRRRRLSGAARQQVQRQWKQVLRLDDPARQVLDGDAVLDKALTALGYNGPLGDKLRAAGPRFTDLDGVWRAHKLRNRIAHEPGTVVSPAQAKAALSAFRRALDDLM